jgi:hypothetical protein
VFDNEQRWLARRYGCVGCKDARLSIGRTSKLNVTSAIQQPPRAQLGLAMPLVGRQEGRISARHPTKVLSQGSGRSCLPSPFGYPHAEFNNQFGKPRSINQNDMLLQSLGISLSSFRTRFSWQTRSFSRAILSIFRMINRGRVRQRARQTRLTPADSVR